MENKKLLMMAGGTGGHVYPALVIAKRLHEAGVAIHWLGTARGLEARLIPKEPFTFHQIKARAARGGNIKRKILMPWHLSRGFYEAYSVIRRIKPDIVMGMGGYVSAPGGVMSWLSRKPLIIHEQNAVCGLANKLLSRIATLNLEAFANTFPAARQAIHVGNPVRDEIAQCLRAKHRAELDNNKCRVLVLGGSQGAFELNQKMPDIFSRISCQLPLEIRHQCGERSYEQTKKIYDQKKSFCPVA